MATAPSVAVAAAAERQRRLALRDLLNAEYQWIDRTWDAVFWITAIFVVAGAVGVSLGLVDAALFAFGVDAASDVLPVLDAAPGTVIVSPSCSVSVKSN